MFHRIRSLGPVLLALLLSGRICCAVETTTLRGNGRIVFIGDSITGQGGGWVGAGFVFRMREALSAVDREGQHDLVPLGGSGMGVGSWLDLVKDEAKQKHDLDVKGVEVAASLSQPAEVMVVMLGMNDVLAPYVSDTDAALDQWIANYRELVGVLAARLQPRVIALATITPQTEDAATPMNRVLARMNQRIMALAADLKARVLPTNAIYWEVLAEGRKTQADFRLAGDRIHPTPVGHVTVAMAMLQGLGENQASAWLREERLAKALAGLLPTPPPAAPPAWLVASGLVLPAWDHAPADADLAPNPIDLAIERGEDFTKAAGKVGGPPLAWSPFQSSINLTDGANPGSVDFAAITYFQNFEAGYGARWIHSATDRRLRLDLKTSGVGTAIHLTVWLNGQRLYSDLLANEPNRQMSREVALRAGWNVLVFKSCHRTWQWQQALTLTELDGSTPPGLQYRAGAQSPDLTLARDKNWLVIQGPHLPKGEIRINYLEAYCRTGSTIADWHDTTIGHTTELVSLSDDKKTMKLRCTVKDGVVVEHTITASTNDVTFAITAHNPTATASSAHWAQPCIRLGDFTGYDNAGKDIDDYLPKCFLFLDGKLTRMSAVKPWSKEARYTPGQVWCPKDVPRTDVNPRPLSPLVPSNGLIGCFSGDEKQIFAVAFEPYQELFQGVARCVHSDFRIGGLKPGETKHIKGKIYLIPNDVPALLARYAKDFPEQTGK